MLVGAAKEVSGGALGHQRSRIVTAVRQPSVRQAAVLGFVELAPWLSFARALAIPRLQESISSASSTSCAIGSRGQPGVSRCFGLDETGRSSTRCRLPPRLLTHCRAATGLFPRPISQPGPGDRRSIRPALK
jgi:hypothetical protein